MKGIGLVCLLGSLHQISLLSLGEILNCPREWMQLVSLKHCLKMKVLVRTSVLCFLFFSKLIENLKEKVFYEFKDLRNTTIRYKYLGVVLHWELWVEVMQTFNFAKI